MSQADACDWMLRLKVLIGDITKEKVAAVVNAANESLLGGGGVDGAIQLTSLALPAISCGAFGYPLDRAARIARGAIRSGLLLSVNCLVAFVAFVVQILSFPSPDHGSGLPTPRASATRLT